MWPSARILPRKIWRQRPSSSSSLPPSKRFICASCRTAARRNFSCSSSSASRAAESPPSGLVALSSRRLIAVSGPDAPKFLQGIITQNIFATNQNATTKVRDDGFYSAILTASGRLLYDVFVYPDRRVPEITFGSSSGGGGGGGTATAGFNPGESFLIEVDADQAARLEKHIKRYKLRAKFNVRLLPPGEVTIWHGWSDTDSAAMLHAQHVHDQGHAHHQKLVHFMEDPRAPRLGYRMLTVGEDEPRAEGLPSRLVVPSGSDGAEGEGEEAAYRVRRYLFGVPEGQRELLQEKALPLEGNLDVMGGVDFRKGCYVGQELTIRTKHRGVVRKRVLPVMLYGGQSEGEGATNSHPPDTLEYRPDFVVAGGGIDAADIPTDTSIGRMERKGRSAGKWLRGVGNVGLALCRLETMTDVVLPGETAATSYSPADEFVMEVQPGADGEATGGANVKVKAFVPEWLRRGLDGQQHG